MVLYIINTNGENKLEHHTIGKVEIEIIKHLATHRHNLIKRTYVALQKDRKTVNLAFVNLGKKGLIKKGKTVVTSKNGKYPGYELTEEGIITAILGNADFETMAINYPDNPLMDQYKKLVKTSRNKSLARKIVRKAAQLALVQDDKKAVNKNTGGLLDLAFVSMQMFSRLPANEIKGVQSLQRELDNAALLDPEVNALWNKKKGLIREQFRKAIGD